MKCLFIHRDSIIRYSSPNLAGNLDALEFSPGVFIWLGRIARELDFNLVLMSSDGTATSNSLNDFVKRALANEGIRFSEVLAEPMVVSFTSAKDYDIMQSFIISSNVNDSLTRSLCCKVILLTDEEENGNPSLNSPVALQVTHWESVYALLKIGQRIISHQRHTNETKIDIKINLDGTGDSKMETGLNFFNHMLDQLARHSGIDMEVYVAGDLHIDEHHTIEDTAIALGEAMAAALGNKAGIERYGFTLPMDDSLAQVAIDFGGRSWLVWEVVFNREKIGDMPTEMFYHFFKSFSDAAKCNINIKAEGTNEHHKIESIFKAFAKSIKMAAKRDPSNMQIPTTKGLL